MLWVSSLQRLALAAGEHLWILLIENSLDQHWPTLLENKQPSPSSLNQRQWRAHKEQLVSSDVKGFNKENFQVDNPASTAMRADRRKAEIRTASLKGDGRNPPVFHHLPLLPQGSPDSLVSSQGATVCPEGPRPVAGIPPGLLHHPNPRGAAGPVPALLSSSTAALPALGIPPAVAVSLPPPSAHPGWSLSPGWTVGRSSALPNEGLRWELVHRVRHAAKWQ